MQAPPPVSVRGTGGRAWSAVQAALASMAAASFTAWSLDWVGVAAPTTLLWVTIVPLGVGLGFVLWRLACPSAAGTLLTWDGQQWQVDGTAGRLDVMIDLDRWLLLRFEPQAGGRTRWPAIRAEQAGAAWHSLRIAVHARVPRPAAAE